MSENSSTSSHSLSIDEFVALNDEIASLLKAGVPLDIGLSGFASSVSGRLSIVSREVADTVRRGDTLVNALESTQSQMPVAYRAILEAGAESGRLPQAVESLADHARRLKETHRQIALALIYPTLVVLMAYCLFWSFTQTILPRMLESFSPAVEGQYAWMSVAESVQRVMRTLGVVPPVILVCLLIWIVLPIRGGSRQAMLDFRGMWWMPGARAARRAWNLSAFTDIASRLMHHGVPEHRALQLAANTTDDRVLIGDVHQVTNALQSGDTARSQIDSARSFPSFMKWMWKAAEQQPAIIPTFQQLSDHYRRKAESRIARIQIIFPIAITVIVGGGVVTLYALAVFTPITQLMNEIAREAF